MDENTLGNKRKIWLTKGDNDMCVKTCECNSCYTRNTCTDCIYCNNNKNVDCSKNGVQNCGSYRPFGSRLMIHNKQQ